MIHRVTTERLRRHVTRTLRAFVRETQAPLITVLASQAAYITTCIHSLGGFLMSSTPSTSISTKPWNDRNHVEFEGRVGVTPELRITKKNPVASTTLYVANEYNSGNERKKHTTRIPVILYGEIGKAFAQAVGTGDRIKVEGKLQENTWKDEATQQNRSRLEMVAFTYALLKKKTA
jgi:single-stranded DNA-binding protein